MDALLKQEFRLLLDSIRYPLLPEEIERLRQNCGNPLDWQVFLSLVNRHQVGSLVYQNFTNHVSGVIPHEVMEQLRTRSKQNQQAMMVTGVELAAIARRFATEGIMICPLKGILLSQQYYDSASLRNVGDIDILIPHEKLDQGENLLLSLGYSRIDPSFNLSPKQKQRFEHLTHHYRYVNQQRRNLIELHWGIGSSHEISPAITSEMLARAQKFNFLGIPFLTLTREDTLVFLAIHGAKHDWSRLKWLVDLEALIRQIAPIDWNCVISVVKLAGKFRSFSESLLLAQQLLGLSLPDPVRNFILPRQDNSDLIDFWKTALQKSSDPSTISDLNFKFWHTLLEIRQYSDFKGILNYLAIYRYNPGDWQDFPLPDRLFWLYSVLRPYFWTYRKLILLRHKRSLSTR